MIHFLIQINYNEKKLVIKSNIKLIIKSVIKLVIKVVHKIFYCDKVKYDPKEGQANKTLELVKNINVSSTQVCRSPQANQLKQKSYFNKPLK